MAAKSAETRKRILEAALELFRRQGFDRTTMREIAQEADVAQGAAYYYFESKEALVMAFYELAAEEMSERIAAALPKAKGIDKRLRSILDVKFEYFAPNRRFLGALFGHAADPQNPLSPFSRETSAIRERDLAHFASALEGSGTAVPKDLAPHLPKLLWLYQMGLILFWIYDRSDEQKRTAQLREKSLGLVVTGLKMISFPLLRPLRKRIVDLIATVEGA
jgi:AcrR family transcriptional regulator